MFYRKFEKTGKLKKLTRLATKGATMDPTLAAVMHDPNDKCLIVVGNISTV